MIEASFKLPCGLTIPNRLVKAAMTERLAGVDGRATERHARLFKRFAEGGAGLLLTGNVVIDASYLEAPGNVFIEDEGGLETLKRWANAGRSCGGAMIMQLNHAGRQTPRSVAEVSLAPSATPLTMRKFFSTPRAMAVSEIEEAVARFAFAARVAEKAGFNGVEIHAAHGYLISQFLSPRVNKRDDAWGGDITNRARFLVRTVDAIRRTVSSSFAVGVKLNVADFIKGGLEPDDALRTVQMLDPLGLDFLELSGGTHERAVSFGFGGEAEAPHEAYFKASAIEFRKATSIPLILTGGVHRRATIEALLAANVCDMVGMARPLAIEPDLPGRFIRGEADAARVIKLKLPKPPRDTLADLMWRREQLVRLSDGRAPKLSLSPKLALVRMLIEESSFAKKRAKYLRRSPAFRVGAYKHGQLEGAAAGPSRRAPASKGATMSAVSHPDPVRSSLGIETLFERYVTTFATRKVEAIVTLHAEGGTFWLHAGVRPVQGREAIGKTFAGFFEQWPEFGFEQYRVLFTERSWILDWAATAVLTTSGGEKRPIRFDCLDVVDVGADGLVVRKDTFIDLVQVQGARASAVM